MENYLFQLTHEFLNKSVFSTNDENNKNKGNMLEAISTGISLLLKKISDWFYNDTANPTETLDCDTRKCISDANNLVSSAGDEAVVVTKKFWRKFVNGKNDTITATFKCVVCYESWQGGFAVCLDCGRYLCCHICIGRLSKGPLCRKDVANVWNIAMRLRKKTFFPGIEKFFDIPVSSVPNPPARLDLEGYDTDDTSPAVSGA